MLPLIFTYFIFYVFISFILHCGCHVTAKPVRIVLLCTITIHKSNSDSIPKRRPTIRLFNDCSPAPRSVAPPPAASEAVVRVTAERRFPLAPTALNTHPKVMPCSGL